MCIVLISAVGLAMISYMIKYALIAFSSPSEKKTPLLQPEEKKDEGETEKLMSELP
jgi:hypothetical protein